MADKIHSLEGWRNYDDALAAAKKALTEGKLVVYPTDTLYGLGANALDENAVARAVAAKGRPDGKPISIIVSDLEMMEKYAEVPSKVSLMLQVLLPGPFTVVLKAKKGLPKQIAPEGKVGVRMPHHIFVITVVRQLGLPITATSANLSGGKNPVKLEDVPTEVCRKSEVVLDGGPTKWQDGSTVIDFTHEKPVILRKGANCGLAEQVLCSF